MPHQLVAIYRQLDADCALLADQVRSARSFEQEAFIPTRQNVDAVHQRIERLLRTAESLIAPDAVYALLRNHFVDFLQGQKSALSSRSNRPGITVSGLSSLIDFMVRKDSRDPDERAQILCKRLEQADLVWSELSKLLPETAPQNVQEVTDACRTLGNVATIAASRLPLTMPDLSSDLSSGLTRQLSKVTEQSSAWLQEATSALTNKTTGKAPPMTGDEDIIRLDEDYYRQLLSDELGVDLDDLLEWHEQEVQKTRAEVFEIAARVTAPNSPPLTSMAAVVHALNAHAGACDSVNEMFRRGREYLGRAKAGAAGFVRLPAESCIVGEVPEQVRAHFPWGGYGGGCQRRRPLLGEMFLNETNYRAVTDGWLKMMAIHEGYPGHHVQFVRTAADPLPETVKLGARSVPLTEGTAHRSERVFEFVFEEDPFYPLFVAYRRHHTAVRIKAELSLRYFGRPIGDAVQLYMDELGFDRATARGQVKAQELMVGYFNCYYYGMKRLQDLEKQFGYNQRAFTELLFAAGRISLDNFEAFLALSEPDQQRYLSGFSSLF